MENKVKQSFGRGKGINNRNKFGALSRGVMISHYCGDTNER
jgi:hypothetical protein